VDKKKVVHGEKVKNGKRKVSDEYGEEGKRVRKAEKDNIKLQSTGKEIETDTEAIKRVIFKEGCIGL
jgi:hypothetical protein